MPKKPDINKTIAVIAGIGQRAEDQPGLAITATDARLFEKELLARCPFNPANCHSFTGPGATRQAFVNRLTQLAQQTAATEVEMVVVYFSGHGCAVDGEHYLIFHDTANATIPDTALKGSVFVELLDAIRTEKMLVFLDCCHATGVTKPEAMPFEKNPGFLNRPNRIVIASSHAQQLSYVSNPVSVFTFALIEGLAGAYFKPSDQDVTVFDLAMYIRERVYPLSEYRQQPQLHTLRSGHTSNFVITRYPNGQPRPPAFDTGFALLDGAGKAIPTSGPIQPDKEYRNQYQWILNTEINFDNSINFSGVTGPVYVFANTNGPQQIEAIKQVLKPDPLPTNRTLEDIVLIKKNELVFVGRKQIKQHLEKMLRNNSLGIYALDGPGESGLSYFRHLLSDVSEEYKYYEFKYLNMSKLEAENETGRLEPEQLAEAIADKLNIVFNKQGEFKTSRFLNALGEQLRRSAKQDIRYLVYLDQFGSQENVPLAHFISDLVAHITDENIPLFLIIGGHKEVQKWDEELRQLSHPTMMESHFTRAEIEDFLRKLFFHQANAFHQTMTWETFLASTKIYLKDSFFEPRGPNVKKVGTALNRWLGDIRTS